MEFTDYYGTLGVARDADQTAIRNAYRKLARKLHPDINQDPEAEARFKRINEAYEVLKDPVKRGKYDRLGANWEELERRQEFAGRARTRAHASSGQGFSDFFETFFGGGIDLDELFASAGPGGGRTTFQFRTAPGPQQAWRGADIEDTVDITVEEAVGGGVRLLSVGDRTVEVRFPPGVTEGSRVRVGGEGGDGGAGGARGDVLLRVKIRPHPRYAVRDRDLVGEVVVRDDQAALGATVDVECVTGPLRVSIPAGSQSGRILRLRGKGIPGLRGARPGDLLLTVRVTVPKAISDAERDLYSKLSDLRGGPSGGSPG